MSYLWVQLQIMFLFLLANPNIRSSISSGEVTPLHVAAANGNLACLETLVESGSNPLAKDAQNRLPRDHAQANGQDLCLEYLQKQSGMFIVCSTMIELLSLN